MDPIIQEFNDLAAKCQEAAETARRLQVQDAAKPEKDKLLRAERDVYNAKGELLGLVDLVAQRAEHVASGNEEPGASSDNLTQAELRVLMAFKVEYQKFKATHDSTQPVTFDLVEPIFKKTGMLDMFGSDVARAEKRKDYEEMLRRHKTCHRPAKYHPILINIDGRASLKQAQADIKPQGFDFPDLVPEEEFQRARKRLKIKGAEENTG